VSRTPPVRTRRIPVAGLGAMALGLLALGAISIAWSAGLLAPAGPVGPPPGSVAIPVASVAIPAYTRIELQHLVDPRTGSLAVVYLPEGSLLPATLTRPEDVIGRVLATDKSPGLLFTKNDLLPEGTRPGVVAGIPAGKRALRIDAAQVSGIAGLQRGDRFDLVATQRADATPPGASRSPAGLGPRAHLLVEEGIVVAPLAVREIPAARGGATLVQEIVVGLAPDEVPRLMEAIASGARIDALPRSGRPDASGEAPARTNRRSWNGVRQIERIAGGQRETFAVPEAADDGSALLEIVPPRISAVPPPSAGEVP
jgi:Flp pilus assembly protein CpaB